MKRFIIISFHTTNILGTKVLSKLEPGQIVKFKADTGAGTVQIWVNGVDQGVCFTNVGGKTMYPACGFYSSAKKVKAISFTSLGPSTYKPPAAATGGLKFTHSSDPSHITFDTGNTIATSGSGVGFSSNRCAAICNNPINGIATFEFKMEVDASGNQMTTYGLSDSLSPDGNWETSKNLWMYRPYNGYLYNGGTRYGNIIYMYIYIYIYS